MASGLRERELKEFRGVLIRVYGKPPADRIFV